MRHRALAVLLVVSACDHTPMPVPSPGQLALPAGPCSIALDLSTARIGGLVEPAPPVARFYGGDRADLPAPTGLGATLTCTKRF